MNIHSIDNKIHLIDPNLSFKDKFTYIKSFTIRAFLIAVFLLFITFLLFVFVYFGDLLVNVKQGKYKNPLYSAYIIVSGSMVPTINIQDGVFVRRNNNLKIGDIITFNSTSKSMNITHRIVGKEKLSNGVIAYRTKGDHNKFVDSSLVSYDNIFGKVMIKFPKLGYVYKFITNPIGLIITLLITVLLILSINFNTRRMNLIRS